MGHLHLQMRSHESRSRVQQDDTPIKERPKRKHVSFDVDEELGDEPRVPTDLNLSLVDSMAKE